MKTSDEGEASKGEKEAVRHDDDEGVTLLGRLSIEPRLSTRDRKLVILSLGGLLCERVLIRENPSRVFNARRPYDAAYGSFVVYKRPHCETFLKFCFEKFDVAIWSTAKSWYTENALDCVMTGLKRSGLVFVWNQEHATDSGFKSLQKKDRPIFLKRLSNVWDRYWSTTSGSCNRQYSALNTLMIEFDDVPERTLSNPPNTAVFAPEYNFENDDDNVLAPGGELWKFLDGLSRAEDVGSYVKANPYGPPAITAAHPEWAYYQEIIHAHGGSS
ncbi:unnamed protein product [Linum tenue]|uniref:Mitochondrial import inner membrane translocase subunit TIM50 n=1 Tax=Linum tenue TaxID=586396 RepID=A0AAV0P3R1_9ROSI|nr:unnamed protein product [Linum tenue]